MRRRPCSPISIAEKLSAEERRRAIIDRFKREPKRGRRAVLIPASQTPVTLPLPLFTRGFVATGSFTGRAGGPRQGEFSDSFRLGRSRHSARPALGPVCGSLSALSLSGKPLVPRQVESWRNGVETAARGAEKRHTNYKPRCFVSAPLPRLSKPRAKEFAAGREARPAERAFSRRRKGDHVPSCRHCRT